MPEEFLLKLSKLGSKTDEIIPKVLGAGGEVALKAVRKNLVLSIGKEIKEETDRKKQRGSRSTGQLINSLGLTSAKLDRNGKWNVKVGFSIGRRALRPEDSGLRKKIVYASSVRRQRSREERKKHNFRQAHAVTNHDVAFFLEYGKHNQPPRPFLKPAKSQARQASIEAMKAKFDSEVSKL